MAYNIGDNPTALALPAGGDKVKVHDISADSEKYSTVAQIGQAWEHETFDITTGTPDYTVTEASGRNVWLYITETNDTASQISMPAAGMVDGQVVQVTYAAALTANATFEKGGATAILGTWGAGVGAGGTFRYTYRAANDTWYGGILSLS